MVRIKPQVQQAGPGVLKRLSSIKPNGKVLSLYLDLNPSQFATAAARSSEVTSLLGQAESQVESFDHDQKKSALHDIELIKDFLINDDEWPKDARAVGIFCSSAAGLFEIIKLPESVPPAMVVEDKPFIQPIARTMQSDSWVVALVDRRAARFFIGDPTRLRELEGIEDPVHRRHEQGGWSQARYQRSIEEEVEDHLKNTAERLLLLRKQTNFDRLVIGCADELWPRLESRLHSYVGEHLVSRVHVDNHIVGIEDLQDQIQQVAMVEDKRLENALLARLRFEAGSGGKAATGIEEVLRCLNEARVETLLLADGFAASGVLCPSCGFLGTSDARCPLDASPTVETKNIVNRAIQRAVETSADHRVVMYEPDLAALGGIAAILRF